MLIAVGISLHQSVTPPQLSRRDPASLQTGVQQDVIDQLPVRGRQIVPGRVEREFQKAVQDGKPDIARVLLRNPVVEQFVMRLQGLDCLRMK